MLIGYETRMEIEQTESEAIGLRIRRFRESLSMSAKDFARANGFSPSQLANWEYGNRRISVDASMRLVTRYGLTLDYIYMGRLSSLPHSLATSLSLRDQSQSSE